MRHLLAAALRPWEAFPRWAERPDPWPRALGRMLLLRVPLAWVELLLGWWSLGLMLRRLPATLGPHLAALGRPSGIDPRDLEGLLAQVPPLPGLGQAWPWLLAAAPVLVIGAWLHHAVWDHTCLWLLGGVRRETGFRASLEAEAEAMAVGALGAAVGLLGALPLVGLLLGLPLAGVALWFWALRGFALAARHRCPPWKGVVATGLHLLLAGCLGLALVAWMVFTLAAALGGAP